MYARRRRRALLLSSSAMALLIGAGMPSAWAASCVNTISAGFDNPAAHTTANVCVQNTSFTGNITNEGTISPSGIALVNGTVTGSISSTGVIKGGISIDKNSALMALGSAIFFSAPTLTGGIHNAGTVSAGGTGILAIGNISTFAGGIANTGTVSAFTNGIVVGGAGGPPGTTLSAFNGGISNGGTITVSSRNGIIVGGTATNAFHVFSRSGTISTFAGGISNTGTISSANGNGIIVGGKATFNGLVSISTFSSGITNSGAITAAQGIVVGGFVGGSGGAITISNFSGGISNGGTISAHVNGVMVGGTATGFFGAPGSLTISTFTGGISNSGIITHATNGIIVGGKATFGALVSLSSFSGNISNSGSIRAGHGIVVGGLASSGGTVSVSNFSGAISNSGRIAAHTGSGILVGGVATGSHAAVTISTFSGGITNSGRIAAVAGGISVGGAVLGSSVAVTISTFGGGISNSGRILARGPGIMVGGTAIGTGASVTISTFSGGITNSGRITSVSADGIFVGGHALSLGTSASAGISIFSGDILNTGTIRAAVSGIHVGGSATGTAVAGVSSFVGNVSNAGRIVAGFDGIEVSGVSAFTGDIINSGRIAALATGISLTNVSTFSGNIWNNGLIVAGSVGIFVCNCATFAGGSIVNTGTIAAATGILVHNFAPVSIFVSGTIVGTHGIAVDLRQATGGNTFTLGPGYSITGRVLGHGGDTFQLGGVGSDSFDLSSVGSSAQYRNFANFNVVSGTWTVFNVFGQSQTWNVDGGILAGTGDLSAINVNNGGTLEPGNIGAPGTVMTTGGSLTFQPGATYLINLDGTTASRIDVGTTASLNGAVDGILAPGNYSGKTTYDILDATGFHHGPVAITGMFTGFTPLNEPGFTGTLTYLPDEVLLNLTAQLGVGGGLNTNQQNAATAINTAFNNGGTLPASFFPLFGLTGNNLGNALTQLDGELNSDAERGAFQLMNQFLDLMLDPYVDGRTNGVGGGGLGFAPDQQATFPSDIALAYDAILKAPPKATFDQRWSTWGSAFGGTSKTDGDPLIGSRTVNASDYGFAAGMDYRMSPDTVVGFSLGGGGTGWNLAQAFGTGRSDSFLAGAYGITHWGAAYLAAALGFANHWFSTDRTALGDQITASFVGQSYAARAEVGYRYALPSPANGGWGLAGVTPYAALQTQWFQTPTYSETDLTGGGFGLTYNAMTANDTRSELGARFDDLTSLGAMPLILRGRVAWAHDWVSNPALSAAFQALPGAAFTVNGAPVPQNSALTTASAELRFTPRWSLTAQFDGEFASSSQTYAGTGTLRYRW
jgi:uncharacterized protein with beta-barrel porin domain